MKNILVTGGLGFIGFNAIRHWKQTRPGYNYVVLDKETYAAQFKLNEKKAWLAENGVKTYRLDIVGNAPEQSLIENAVVENDIDTIVNFAAESHVDNSISTPAVFFDTNVIGTVNLINIAKKHRLRFHQIGTDEVYGETWPQSWVFPKNTLSKPDGEFIPAEQMCLAPSSPYSASKAAADLAVLSYCRTFNLNATVSRCSNNFGPWQHPEKLIGTVISNIMANKPVPVYGDGLNRRHWIYVDEHNDAVMDILERGISGKIYNISPPGQNWITNMQLVRFIIEQFGKDPMETVEFVKDRPGHDVSYFMAGTDFCRKHVFWKTDMVKTIDWYKENISK